MIINRLAGLACEGNLLGGALKLNTLFAVGSQLSCNSPLSKLKVDSGTLSFLLASISTSFAPNLIKLDARFEGLAWTYFLQSALVLGLWAEKSQSDQSVNSISSINSVNSGDVKSNSKEWITFLAVFLIGTIGSTVGGFLGYHIAKNVPQISKGSSSILLTGALPVLSACLTASYIGGTVNFFETARILGAVTCDTTKALVKIVAGVDIGVMVLYFMLLSAMRDSSLKRLLPPRGDRDGTFISPPTSIVTSDSAEGSNIYFSTPSDPSVYNPLGVNKTESVTSVNRQMNIGEVWKYLPPLAVSTLIIFLSSYVQRYVPIPGVSVIVATFLGMFFKQLVQEDEKSVMETPEISKISGMSNVLLVEDTEMIINKNRINTNRIKAMSRIILRTFNEQSGACSAYMMGLFYATIGLGFQFDKIKTIIGPVGTLIGVTLASHLFVIITGSVIWNYCLNSIEKFRNNRSNSDRNNDDGFLSSDRNTKKRKKEFLEYQKNQGKIPEKSPGSCDLSEYRIDLDTALVASNACVGGAATAAQMASTMPQRAGKVNLVLAASSVGTLGYLIGTPIGLLLAGVLGKQ